ELPHGGAIGWAHGLSGAVATGRAVGASRARTRTAWPRRCSARTMKLPDIQEPPVTRIIRSEATTLHETSDLRKTMAQQSASRMDSYLRECASVRCATWDCTRNVDVCCASRIAAFRAVMWMGSERLGALVRDRMHAEPRSRVLFVFVGQARPQHESPDMG